MKILAIFIDMVGADYLNLCNSERKITSLDKYLSGLGGTLYANCYTPAPDTPRSSACMWSGLYPKANGCNNRLKYPGKFLNREIDNLWDALKEKKYKLNIFLRKTAELNGLLPYGCSNRVFNGTIDEFFEFAEIADDSFTFFYLPDLHTYFDINSYSNKEFVKGARFVSRLLEKIIGGFGKECFDYTIIFSDHGFAHAGLKREHVIDRDRVKTLMYVRKKHDRELVVDYELRSNLDLFPTVCDIIGYTIPNKIDGRSLFEAGHDYILLEDHDNFSVSLGQTIEHWGVALKDNMLWLECTGKWSSKAGVSESDLQKYELLIKEKMDNYEENVRFFQILHLYDANASTAINNKYSDGTPVKERKLRKRIKRTQHLVGLAWHYVFG